MFLLKKPWTDLTDLADALLFPRPTHKHLSKENSDLVDTTEQSRWRRDFSMFEPGYTNFKVVQDDQLMELASLGL